MRRQNTAGKTPQPPTLTNLPKPVCHRHRLPPRPIHHLPPQHSAHLLNIPSPLRPHQLPRPHKSRPLPTRIPRQPRPLRPHDEVIPQHHDTFSFRPLRPPPAEDRAATLAFHRRPSGPRSSQLLVRRRIQPRMRLHPVLHAVPAQKKLRRIRIFRRIRIIPLDPLPARHPARPAQPHTVGDPPFRSTSCSDNFGCFFNSPCPRAGTTSCDR